MWHLHRVLGFLGVLTAGPGVHDDRAARDQRQVVCVHPGAAEARRGARQLQEAHDHGPRKLLDAKLSLSKISLLRLSRVIVVLIGDPLE